MRPKSLKLTLEQNPKCLCKYHYDLERVASVESVEEDFNEKCPICISEEVTEESGAFYPLGCTHRFHINCLSGMTKAECPLCREPAINLPKSVKDKIDENSKKYREEIEQQEERDFQRMIEEEGGMMLQPVRLPPHIELILALKYVFQLGIPISLIPTETVLEIDPQSPLPDPGSIFQNTVKHLIQSIQHRSALTAEEDDESLGEDSPGEEEIILDEDGEDPFVFEGEDLQIVHRVRTVPARDQNGRYYSSEESLRAVAGLFSTARFQIANLPDLTQEDLINLRMGRREGRDFETSVPGSRRDSDLGDAED